MTAPDLRSIKPLAIGIGFLAAAGLVMGSGWSLPVEELPELSSVLPLVAGIAYRWVCKSAR